MWRTRSSRHRQSLEIRVRTLTFLIVYIRHLRPGLRWATRPRMPASSIRALQTPASTTPPSKRSNLSTISQRMQIPETWPADLAVSNDLSLQLWRSQRRKVGRQVLQRRRFRGCPLWIKRNMNQDTCKALLQGRTRLSNQRRTHWMQRSPSNSRCKELNQEKNRNWSRPFSSMGLGMKSPSIWTLLLSRIQKRSSSCDNRKSQWRNNRGRSKLRFLRSFNHIRSQWWIQALQLIKISLLKTIKKHPRSSSPTAVRSNS